MRSKQCIAALPGVSSFRISMLTCGELEVAFHCKDSRAGTTKPGQPL
ncbi:hypothetical protein NY08_1892 [Rhodococcus sp. B7740]|nr:hypothetical protein NY08_1892 [Rhodococcus sp. B7740]